MRTVCVCVCVSCVCVSLLCGNSVVAFSFFFCRPVVTLHQQKTNTYIWSVCHTFPRGAQEAGVQFITSAASMWNAWHTCNCPVPTCTWAAATNVVLFCRRLTRLVSWRPVMWRCIKKAHTHHSGKHAVDIRGLINAPSSGVCVCFAHTSVWFEAPAEVPRRKECDAKGNTLIYGRL